MYLIKWQHRIQYFVQLSLFVTIVNVTVNLKL
jgi:formate hydrogenlyase subunit 4